MVKCLGNIFKSHSKCVSFTQELSRGDSHLSRRVYKHFIRNGTKTQSDSCYCKEYGYWFPGHYSLAIEVTIYYFQIFSSVLSLLKRQFLTLIGKIWHYLLSLLSQQSVRQERMLWLWAEKHGNQFHWNSVLFLAELILSYLEQLSEGLVFVKNWSEAISITVWYISRPSASESILFCSSLDEAVSKLRLEPFCDVVENIWIIGGASVYLVMMNIIYYSNWHI